MNAHDQSTAIAADKTATRQPNRKARGKRNPGDTADNTVGKLSNLKPFKPGPDWTGNANGRPKGARNRLCARYIEDLQDVWISEGKKAIRKAAKERPVAFINAVGNLVPREYDLGDKTAGQVDWVAVWRALGNGSLNELLAGAAGASQQD